MRFTVDDTTYNFNAKRVTFAEGRALEKVTGLTFKDLSAAAETGSMLALQGFLWVAMKRTRPELRFADLDDMSISDFDMQRDEDDAQEAVLPPAQAGAHAAAPA